MTKKHILRLLTLTLTLMLALSSSGLALTLRYPQKSPYVASLQTALMKVGYYTGEIDGVYGKGTRASVSAFQAAYQLSADGIAGPVTIARLESLSGISISGTSATPSPTPGASATGLFSGVYTTLQFGSRGTRVRTLQRALTALGYAVTVDGDFGSGTFTAVKAFQTANGLTADGKAGKKTLQKLETYFDKDGNLIGGTAPTTAPDTDPAYDVPTRTLRLGMSGEDVRYTQQRLYTLGYYTGTRDGRFGTGTQTAIRAFQRRNGLSVDGVLGTASIKALFSTSAIAANAATPTPDTALSLGAKGEAVTLVQQRLKALGYYTKTVDGQYGTGTVSAVKAFQTRNGLTSTGVCDAATQARLFSADAIAANAATPTPNIIGIPSGTLQFGDSGEDVKTLQNRLKLLGYYTGTVDGQYGTGTYSAVQLFQARNGLTVDGKAGALTLARLFSADAIASGSATPSPSPSPTPTPTPTLPAASTPTATPSRTLRSGDTGEDVRLLQQRLIDLGYLKSKADGIFGSGTVTAVKAFQKANGLTADGVAGSATYRKLYSDSAVSAPDAGITDGDLAIPTRTLTYGATGDDVKSVQTRLKQLKYYTGTVDGQYGESTVSAMKTFQQMNNLTVTGEGNLATYAALYSDDAITAEGVKDGTTVTYTTLRAGATGAAVTRLQQTLAGYNYPVSVTGVYDDATVKAVRSFQVNNGLSVDGVAGKNTQAKLYSGSCISYVPGTVGATYGSAGYVAKPSLSQVKLLHWNDDIKSTLSYGQALICYDPATDISWSLTIIARTRHCDVEPSTSEDTAAMNAAFIGMTPWDPKPVFVRLPSGVWTVATTHNVAHGINPIPNNDFEGQNCVHFLRDMSETEQKDPNYGVTNQKALRAFWLSLTGESIPYK